MKVKCKSKWSCKLSDSFLLKGKRKDTLNMEQEKRKWYKVIRPITVSDIIGLCIAA